MIPHLQRHNPHPCQPQLATVRRFPHRPHRKWFLIPLAALVAVLALASCSGGDAPPSEPPPVSIDTTPVGEGLKLCGFALLGASVVVGLSRLLKP
jgi:hypothetical protein